LFNLDVDIGKGRKGLVTVHEGDDLQNLATEFVTVPPSQHKHAHAHACRLTYSYTCTHALTFARMHTQKRTHV
jgi:hypothetical protein